MIPKPYRLNLSQDQVIASPKRFPWGLLVFASSSHAAWGVKISNHTHKLAIKRNTLKRQILNYLYQSRAQLANYRAIIIVKKYPTLLELKNLLSNLSQSLRTNPQGLITRD